MLNPYGVVSGGVLFTMVTYGMGAAIVYWLEEGETSTNIEIKFNFISSVSSGVIRADTYVVHQGTRIAFMESRITTEEGKLVAMATGSFYKVKRQRD